MFKKISLVTSKLFILFFVVSLSIPFSLFNKVNAAVDPIVVGQPCNFQYSYDNVNNNRAHDYPGENYAVDIGANGRIPIAANQIKIYQTCIGSDALASISGTVTMFQEQISNCTTTPNPRVTNSVLSITGANGITVYYRHMKSYSVQNGAIVTAGAKIGTIGSVGCSNFEHIHFDVTKDGNHLYYNTQNSSYPNQWKFGPIQIQSSFIAKNYSKLNYADFNGDGKSDMIITTASGSYWMFSNGDGTWQQKYYAPDYKLGNVKYTIGDYNGDGKSDMILTTSSGSYWMFSNGDGTWQQKYYATEYTLGNVDFKVGNFNGVDSDGKKRDDIILITSAGSFWHISKNDWTFEQTRYASEYTLGKVNYAIGDYNGDGRSDIILTTSTGSYWQFANLDGSWSQKYYGSDYTLNNVEFRVGNFNGIDSDGMNRDDVILTTQSGSFWFFSKGDWSYDQKYAATDYTLKNINFTIGDYNGDGKSDMIITHAGGSFWYFSNGDGTWQQKYYGTEYTLNNVEFKVANFNGTDTDNKKRDDVILTTQSGSFWFFSKGDWSYDQKYVGTDYRLKTVSFN